MNSTVPFTGAEVVAGLDGGAAEGLGRSRGEVVAPVEQAATSTAIRDGTEINRADRMVSMAWAPRLWRRVWPPSRRVEASHIADIAGQ